MIELGKKQELTVAKLVDFGVYLGETENAGEKETVLPVSYTHLDVYKRQIWRRFTSCIP